MLPPSSGKCVLCGKPLARAEHDICAECVARYRQDHPKDCAEISIRTQLKGVRSDVCIVCGDPISSLSKTPVCPWCMEYIVRAEAKNHDST